MKNIIKIMTILSIFMIITGCKQRYKDNPGFKTDTDYTVYINQTSGGVGMENYGFFETKDGKLYLYQCNYDNEPNYYSDFPNSFEEESKNYEPIVIIPQKEVDELLEKADNADLDRIEMNYPAHRVPR